VVGKDKGKSDEREGREVLKTSFAEEGKKFV
jgi:hypothetical protein